MIDPWQLPVKDLVALWEKTGDDDPLKKDINAKLDYLAGDLTLFSREYYYDRLTSGRNSTTLYFLPRSESFKRYGKYATILIQFSPEEVEDILACKKEDVISFDPITAVLLNTPEFNTEKAKLMREKGFNPMHVYHVV